MSDRDALYRAICANPDDDTPRLVYADWLQENDRPEEAEFIRVECALNTLPPDHPEYVELLSRKEELGLWLTAHVPVPAWEFSAGLKVEERHWTRRGFVRFFEYDAIGSGPKPIRSLAAALEKAFVVLPTRWLVVRFVSVPQLAELFRHPVVEQLDTITVQLGCGEQEGAEAARVIANSRLRNLRGASLGFPLGDIATAALAQSSNFTRMDWLKLSSDHITATGMRMLGNTAWFRNLQTLGFDDPLSSTAFEEFCRLDPFLRLHTLDLCSQVYAASLWQLFAQSHAFPALTRLELNGTELADGRAQILFQAPWLRLASLDLGGCGIGNDGAAALADSPWVSSLRYLRLWANGLDPSGAAAIARCRNLTRLQHLDLGHNSLGVSSLRALVANPVLRGLRTLHLEGQSFRSSRLTSGHFHDFLAKLNLPNLRHLDLSEQPVGTRAAQILASEKFRGLTRLGLSNCNVGDKAAASLLTTPALQNLIELNLGQNKLKEGVKSLASRGTLPRLSSCRLDGNSIPYVLRRKIKRRPGMHV